jgi:hypothetical protein
MSIYRFPSVSEFAPEPAGLQATFSDAIIEAARSKRKAVFDAIWNQPRDSDGWRKFVSNPTLPESSGQP